MHITRISAIALALTAFTGSAMAQPVVYQQFALDGAQTVPPSGSSATGTGDFTFDPATSELAWNVVYSGLTGSVTVAHIHGPAPAGGTAGPLITLTTASPIMSSATLTPTQVGHLQSGLLYVNIHSTTSPGGEIRGQILPTPIKVVLNEIQYDGDGSDNGKTFVEIDGPAGTDLTGWRVKSIEAGTSSCGQGNPEDISLAGAIQPDGLFVVADDDGTGGTLVVVDAGHNGGNPDMIVGDIDFENGTDAVQLIHPAGTVVDAVTYGDAMLCTTDVNGDPIVEGNPAFDVFGGFSLTRWPQGDDTDDNEKDFTAQCDPSPGSAGIEPRALFFSGSPTISGTAGGSVDLNIHTDRPGETYLLLGFLTQPTTKDPFGFPFDPLTNVILLLTPITNPFVVNFTGTLDPIGNGTGTFTLPASTTLPFAVSVFFASTTFPINPTAVGTNDVEISLTP